VTLAGDARVGVAFGVRVGVGVVGVDVAGVGPVDAVVAVALSGLVVSDAWRVVLRAAITTTVTRPPRMRTEPAIAARRPGA
jgi:hypothetical protein